MSDSGVIRVDGVDREFTRNRILIVVLVPLAMSLMAMSSVNVALPTIEEGLGASSTDIQWVLSGYGLAFGMSLIPAGRLGDASGRGSYFVGGVALFTIGSILCGLAPNALVLNLFRLIQGLGAGVMGPQTTGMIMQYFAAEARARAFALFGLVVSVSVAIGPLLTGAVIDAVGPQVGWRVAFLIMGPLGVIGVILALRWLPFESERMRRQGRALGVKTPRADIDPVGALLISVAVLCLMVPFMMRGTWLWWLLLPVGLALLVGWVMWEKHYSQRGREPMVRMDLFLYKSFSYGTAVAAVQFLGGASLFALLAIFLQQAAGASALEAGLATLPNAVLSAIVSVWAGKRVLRIGRQLIIVALIVIIVGVLSALLMAPLVASGQIPLLWMALPMALPGFGFGAFGAANQTLSLVDVPVRNGGSAGAVKQTAERTSAAMGNAIITGLFFALAAGAGLVVGFQVAYLVIIAFMFCALAIAVADLRSARTRG